MRDRQQLQRHAMPPSNASRFLLCLAQLHRPSPSTRAGSISQSCLRCRRHYARKTRPRQPAESPPNQAAELASSHISSIIMGTDHCGARVTRSGELEIITEPLARQPHQTALVVTRASATLTEYDFRTVLEDRYHGEGDKGLQEGMSLSICWIVR